MLLPSLDPWILVLEGGNWTSEKQGLGRLMPSWVFPEGIRGPQLVPLLVVWFVI